MIHIISLPSRSELSHLAIPQQIIEVPPFWNIFDLIASVGKNYESFLYFSPHGDQSQYFSGMYAVLTVFTVILLI